MIKMTHNTPLTQINGRNRANKMGEGCLFRLDNRAISEQKGEKRKKREKIPLFSGEKMDDRPRQSAYRPVDR